MGDVKPSPGGGELFIPRPRRGRQSIPTGTWTTLVGTDGQPEPYELWHDHGAIVDVTWRACRPGPELDYVECRIGLTWTETEREPGDRNPVTTMRSEVHALALLRRDGAPHTATVSGIRRAYGIGLQHTFNAQLRRKDTP